MMSPLHILLERDGSIRHYVLKLTRFQNLNRCNQIQSDSVHLALEAYGGSLKKIDKFIEKLS